MDLVGVWYFSRLAVSLKGGYLSVAIPVGVVFLVREHDPPDPDCAAICRGGAPAVLLPLMFQVRDDVREDLGAPDRVKSWGLWEIPSRPSSWLGSGNAVPASWVDPTRPRLLAHTAVVPQFLIRSPPSSVWDSRSPMPGVSETNNSTLRALWKRLLDVLVARVACVSLSLGVLFGLGFRLFDSGGAPSS